MELAEAVSAVHTAIDALANADLEPLPGEELRTQLAGLKIAASQLDGQLARITHACDASGAWVGTGARDTAEWLGNQTGTSTRKNRSAAQLGEAMAKSDELADAVTTGRISSDKAAAAVGVAGDLPLDEDILCEIIDLPLNGVRPATEQWRARTNTNRDEDVSASQRARRYLRLTGQADGMTRVDGLLDPESAAHVRSTLDAVMNRSLGDDIKRTREQRCADALTQLAVAAAKGDIKGGRSNAKILATVPFETVVERAGSRGVSHAGPTLDPASVRALACHAGIHRVITGPASSILDFGRETRLVPDNLFYALVARDQHCRWPGCSIRATWCDAHHIIEWLDGGPTDETTCALLCHRHHSLSHQPGWTITGDAHEFTIHHPDGTSRISRPPPAPPPPSKPPAPPPHADVARQLQLA